MISLSLSPIKYIRHPLLNKAQRPGLFITFLDMEIPKRPAALQLLYLLGCACGPSGYLVFFLYFYIKIPLERGRGGAKRGGRKKPTLPISTAIPHSSAPWQRGLHFLPYWTAGLFFLSYPEREFSSSLAFRAASRERACAFAYAIDLAIPVLLF